MQLIKYRSTFNYQRRLISHIASPSRDDFGFDLQLIENIVSVEEENEILSFLNPILNRKKYEGNHWDDVIYKYKEFELTNRKYKIPDDIKTCLEKVQHIIDNNQNNNKNNNNNRIDFLDSPHIIDLHKDGYIGPHIDSVKFSGDMIAGLSLLSSRIMLLTLADEHKDNKNYQKFNKIYLNLPARSLYILRGPYRYLYEHSILGEKHTTNNDNYNEFKIDYNQRISIIFRNKLLK